METLLEIKQLTKKYGKVIAVDAIDLSIQKGEIYGFIGPNGAGKTTTINVLLGILKANQGSVKIFGLDAWRDAVEIHKRISFVPGDVSLWGNLSGGEVIDLLTSLKENVDTTKKAELMKRFELDPTKKCQTYSKGNKQKVALIAALVADADFYIFDEPTSGLDPLMEAVFQACVQELKKQGKTVLLSSHILNEVEKLCDRVSIIREGKIVETGTLNDLRYLTNITMSIQTKTPIENLNQIEGISGVVTQANRYSFQVDSSALSQVMSELSKYGIEKLESAPPTLEDLFMRYYGEHHE